MFNRYTKGIAVLAVLLISLISISSAASLYAKPDIYQGQCGVELSIPAPGILANDIPSSKLHVLSWTTPSIGNVTVDTNGGFVYVPPQNIRSGTYAYFYYKATDGTGVTNQALVKIAVSCTCRGAAPDINVCLSTGTAITPAFLMSKGAGCIGCRDATPKFDLSKIPAQPVIGECYPYTVSCPGCNLVTGHVCFRGSCTITSVPFTVCPGITPTANQILASGSVSCNCDTAPVISNIRLVGNHWEYTITCQSECGPATGTGIVNIEPPCNISFLAFSIPLENCDGNVLPTAEQILELGVVTCSCDETPAISNIHWVSQPPVGEWTGEYTITCTSAIGCITTETGTFNNELCVECKCAPTSEPFTICSGVTPTASQIVTDGKVSCGDCDATPEISSIHLVGDHWEYTITCTTGAECSKTATGTVNIESPCAPTSVPFTICSGITPTVAQIMANGVVSCGDCDATPVISNVHLVGNHWEYTITCTTALGCSKTATGTVNIETVCAPTSTAFTICTGITPTVDMIESEGLVSCGACDASPVISSIHLVGDHWEYTITCTTDLGCTKTGTGIVNIGQQCDITFLAFSIPPESCAANTLPTIDQILTLGVVNCNCDATPVISNIHWVSQPPGGEWTGEYTITCTSSIGCVSTKIGTFNNANCGHCTCKPTAPNLCGCKGYPFPRALFDSLGGGCHPTPGCDVTPTLVIDDSKVQYNNPGHVYTYTVTCQGCTGNNVVTGQIYIRSPLCGPNGNCICPTHCP